VSAASQAAAPAAPPLTMRHVFPQAHPMAEDVARYHRSGMFCLVAGQGAGAIHVCFQCAEWLYLVHLSRFKWLHPYFISRASQIHPGETHGMTPAASCRCGCLDTQGPGCAFTGVSGHSRFQPVRSLSGQLTALPCPALRLCDMCRVCGKRLAA
jgi:hypothetical protein